MKRYLSLVLFFFTITCLTSVYAGQIKQVGASNYSSNGAFIMGWHWLRQNSHVAQWDVEIPGDIDLTKPVGFCFSTLSTDTYSGGAGYDSELGFKVNPSRSYRSLHLKNDCKCLAKLHRYYNRDSHGIGYHSHGCVMTRLRPSDLENGRTLHVKVKYKNGHHTAVRKDSLKVIYITR